MRVYMAVTRDKYELPLAVADTVLELAKMRKVSPETIYGRLSHQKGKKCIYVKVDIGGDEE